MKEFIKQLRRKDRHGYPSCDMCSRAADMLEHAENNIANLQLQLDDLSEASKPVDPLPGMSEINREIAYCAATKLRELGYEWNGKEWLAQSAAEPAAWGQLGTLNGKLILREHYNRQPYPPPPSIVQNLNLAPLYTHPATVTLPTMPASYEMRGTFDTFSAIPTNHITAWRDQIVAALKAAGVRVKE